MKRSWKQQKLGPGSVPRRSLSEDTQTNNDVLFPAVQKTNLVFLLAHSNFSLFVFQPLPATGALAAMRAERETREVRRHSCSGCLRRSQEEKMFAEQLRRGLTWDGAKRHKTETSSSSASCTAVIYRFQGFQGQPGPKGSADWWITDDFIHHHDYWALRWLTRTNQQHRSQC